MEDPGDGVHGPTSEHADAGSGSRESAGQSREVTQGPGAPASGQENHVRIGMGSALEKVPRSRSAAGAV